MTHDDDDTWMEEKRAAKAEKQVQSLLPSPEELRRIRKRTRDRNYRFKKMRPNRQRVAIARDVIKALKVGRFTAANNGYLSTGLYDKGHGLKIPREKKDAIKRFKELLNLAGGYSDAADLAKDVPLNEVLGDVPCTVCGIGACFVAAVDKVDGITVGELEWIGNDDAMRDHLEKWFDRSQVCMIECAFEQSTSFGENRGVSVHDAQRAANFGARYADPTERLTAIMRDIIENDGTFRP